MFGILWALLVGGYCDLKIIPFGDVWTGVVMGWM